MAYEPIDPIDREILLLLQQDGRRPVSDIASRVGLSPTAAKRRIERLEASRVIHGYSIEVDYARLGWSIAAFVELRFTGTTSPADMNAAASGVPEVNAVYTTAGSEDVLALVRARSVDHLRDVIHRLRRAAKVTGTRTLVILDAHVKHGWFPPDR